MKLLCGSLCGAMCSGLLDANQFVLLLGEGMLKQCRSAQLCEWAAVGVGGLGIFVLQCEDIC